MSEAIVLTLDCIVKARPVGSDGKRVVEVQASSETVDAEGDIILQSALLESAPSFVRSGHLDLDHLSELGPRLGIANPTSYIVGRPLEVKDIGNKCTSVVGEIMKSAGGMDPVKNRYDEFWKSLESDPPVRWQSSIYGYPKAGMVDDCSEMVCSNGATRYVVKGIDWRSLAFTRKPINTSLTGFAKIITAKAMIEEIRKEWVAPPMGLGNMGHSGPGAPPGDSGYQSPQPPRSIAELWGSYMMHKGDCPHCEFESTGSFAEHYKACCGFEDGMSDIMGHALMMMVVKERQRRGF